MWRFKKFNTLSLKTTSGEPVVILQGGMVNTDAGPDFSDARISIGEQLWAGNVEIHIRSSDWDRHAHQKDKAYTNVILHVVYEHDSEIKNANGHILPTLQLKGLFDEKLYWSYERLLNNQTLIPCENHLAYTEELIKENQVERSVIERLAGKSNTINGWLRQNQGDWNATFYQWLGRGFGLKVNAEPMFMLARAVPWQVVLKNHTRLEYLEALFFGVAGMLDDPQDEYMELLARDFQFLQHKYELSVLDKHIWKYSRLRPAAFPTLRIAQLAALLHEHETLFAKFIKAGTIDQVREMLHPKVSGYWNSHYRFGVRTDTHTLGEVGKDFREVLIINVLIPFLFVYGMARDEPFYKQRAIDLLDQMGPENNKITRMYQKLGFENTSAFHSQGLIQLNSQHCKPKKCLNCAIGIDVLKKEND